MNKKAIAFGTILIILTVISIGVSIYYFVHSEDKILHNINTADSTSDFDQELQRIKIYSNEAAKLAASQTLYELSQNALVNSPDCKIYEDRTIWDSSCFPNNLDETFLNLFKINFAKIMDNYPEKLENFEYSLENNILKISGTTLKKDINNYSYTFKFDDLVVINLENQGIDLKELESLYSNIKENMNLKNWDAHITENNGLKLVDLETKGFYLINKGLYVLEKIQIHIVLS